MILLTSSSGLVSRPFTRDMLRLRSCGVRRSAITIQAEVVLRVRHEYHHGIGCTPQSDFSECSDLAWRGARRGATQENAGLLSSTSLYAICKSDRYSHRARKHRAVHPSG